MNCFWNIDKFPGLSIKVKRPSYKAVWNIDNTDKYLNFGKRKEAWDIIWQFFVIEYSLITGKFELLQELGIKGIHSGFKDLWNASHKTQI